MLGEVEQLFQIWFGDEIMKNNDKGIDVQKDPVVEQINQVVDDEAIREAALKTQDDLRKKILTKLQVQAEKCFKIADDAAYFDERSKFEKHMYRYAAFVKAIKIVKEA